VITLTLLMLLSQAASTSWQLPATIEVARDVPVRNLPEGEPDGWQLERGSLYIEQGLKPFLIAKGRTFEMIALEPEGACRIRFDKREYLLRSCPWLDGHVDRQADVFNVMPRQVAPPFVKLPPVIPVIGGDWGNSLRGSATVGFFVPVRSHQHDVEGWQVLIRHGRGGTSLGAGRAMFSAYGLAGEHLVTVTRTASRSGKLSPHATYVGGEIAFSFWLARTSIGFSTRVSGASSGRRNVVTWSLGVLVPIWR
jgi:hypothetical protein